MKNKKYSNKIVLITGISSDIGIAIANRFAKEGWDIVGHYFSSHDKAKQIKKMAIKYKVNHCLIEADFNSEKEIYKLIKKTKNIDISTVINNAGTYTTSKHFSEIVYKDILNTFMVNVFAPFLLTSNIFMRMKRKDFGRIVNISSIAAKYGGSAFSMHYGSSKLALEGLTKTFAKEGAKSNILVNTIRPGVIDTSFHKKFPKNMKKRIAMIPLKRMGSPQDIAGMAYYLGSDKNNFITNEIITIAGGE